MITNVIHVYGELTSQTKDNYLHVNDSNTYATVKKKTGPQSLEMGHNHCLCLNA